MTTEYEPLAGGFDLEKKLTMYGERASDLYPAFEAIVESFRALERGRFDDNGPGWLPLADSTVANRRRRGSDPNKILQDTGALLSSLEGGAGSYTIMTPFSVETGTDVPYAHWHQDGGDKTHASGAGWPPQRKIVELTEVIAGDWTGILQGWIFGGVAVESKRS